MFGEALRAVPALRARLRLISKCGIAPINANRPLTRVQHYNTSREHIVASVNTSLLLKHPAQIRPVLGSGKLERIRLMVKAEALALDRQHWFHLLEAARGFPVP